VRVRHPRPVLRRELRLPPEGYGFLLAAAAIGALIGARAAERLVALLGVVPGLWASVAVTATSYALVALVPSPPLVAVLLALTSAAVIVWNVITVSMRQRIIPVAFMGRVTSGYRLAAWGAMPLGSVVGGKIAGAYGLAAPWAAADAIMLLVVPLIWRLGSLVTAEQAGQADQAEGASRDRVDSPAGARADDPGA
jgi:MFS family permease